MSDIFISYAREDAAWAEALADHFESQDWSVFWDRSLLAGDQFRQVIARELSDAKAVVVLWSSDSVNSNWVLDEARVGMERNILVPAAIDDIAVPLGFGQLQTPRLATTNRDSAQAEIEEIEQSIERLVNPQHAPEHHTRRPRKSAPQRPPFLAAAAMSVFIGAGFWLAPARPDYPFFLGPDVGYWEAAAWSWLGILIMAPAVVIGTRLAHHPHPNRATVRAVGAAAVVGAVLVLLAGDQQSVGFLVAVWTGVSLGLPIHQAKQWLGRAAVLVGTVLGTLWLSPVMPIDAAAWIFAMVTPLALVASDWALSDEAVPKLSSR